MGRIIIDNRSDLEDITAIGLVLQIVACGRESNNNKQYYFSRYCVKESTYQIDSFANKKSDRFVIAKEE
jgi:hypothetical protein